MANPRPSEAVARQLRSIWGAGTSAGLGDGALLDRFRLGAGDAAEAAFSALVERHGPMVLRVCRSGLGDRHEAEDAFQATFMVLARRAGSLRDADSLGPWLHGVAARVSAGARRSGRRRLALERRAAGARAGFLSVEAPGSELESALHEEVQRLPDRFRSAVILCHLEGLTHQEAADRLDCPVGTVRSRLARGRDRLRTALNRRGLAPSSDASPSPAIPPALALAVSRASRGWAVVPRVGLLARLTHPVLRGFEQAMPTTFAKFAALSLMTAAGLGIGYGVTAGRDPKPSPRPPTIEAPQATPRDSPDAARFAALEDRIRDLEKKAQAVALLDELRRDRGLEDRIRDLEKKAQAEGKPEPAPIAPSRTLRKVRARFDDALIAKVLVSPGQMVKDGDPLVELESLDLARAKTQCQVAYVQWDHDLKLLEAREILVKDGRITQIVWADTRNDEKKSRLDYLIAREKLLGIGLRADQVDKLLENLGDDHKPGAGLDATELRNASMIVLTAPFSGRVAHVPAEVGEMVSRKDVLVVIEPTPR